MTEPRPAYGRVTPGPGHRLEPLEGFDHPCKCGHGKYASHDAYDGVCYAPDCPCLDDGDDHPAPGRWPIRIGRLTVWLWSGGWSLERLQCWHCRNLYIGPLGFEWERRLPEEDDDA